MYFYVHTFKISPLIRKILCFLKNTYFFYAQFLFYFCKNQNTSNKLPINAFPIEEKQAIVFDYDTSSWTNIGLLDTTIVLDLRYATANNFVKEVLYPCGRCFLRPEVALVVQQAHKILQRKGLGLKLFDCYRPKPIQEKLWEKVPNANYVTPPWKGSMHNRGAAIDLTIIDASGRALDMGTPYDYFGKEAHHTYQKHPKSVLENRRLLKKTMESVDLQAIRTEWWHYSYQKKKYVISEMQWRCSN